MSATHTRTRITAPWLGLGLACLLMVAAMVLPPLTGWVVHPRVVGGVAPLAADWAPRVGPGTLPALLLGVAAVAWAARLAGSLSFGRLLAVSYVSGVAWLVALASVDGWAGVAHAADRTGQYLQTARATTDIGSTLQHYIDGIPNRWPTHLAGHPPGALLFFVLLVRVGLGGSTAVGIVIVLLAATIPLAVIITLRRLGAEDAARRAAPFLVFAPAAIWLAISADAVFAAIAAWALAALAVGATTCATRRIALSVVAGALLGYCVYLSYGLPLLGLLAIGVLVAARTGRPLPWVLAGAAVVVLVFTAAGYAWWDALPVVRERYYAGIASARPAAYWVWGDLAGLAFSAGPIVGAALASALTEVRRWPAQRAVLSLSLATAGAVVLADLSFMSKAEVERIWLPFVPWLLVATALLADRWRRGGLAVQIALALIVQSLLRTLW